MRKLIYFFILLAVVVFSSCKKKNNNGDATDFDRVRDSVFLYSQEAYYWNDALPTYDNFAPRNFSGSTDIDALQNEVDAISQYKINTATNLPYEYYSVAPGQAKYSFIDAGQTSTSLGGTNADFGMAISAPTATELRIRYVYPGSPAGNAGIKRGELITKINGRANINLSVTADYNFVISAINSTPLAMTLQRTDGTTYDVNVAAVSYTVNPVITYKVFATTNQAGAATNVGYMVLNTFTSPANAKAKIDAAFAEFTSKNITDLIVDLRYNGGGYVSTSEYMANLIVPAAKNNTLMYNTYFNNNLASGKTNLLKNQWRRDQNNQPYNYGQIDYSVAGNAVKFAKQGSLNVNRVFFIVGSGTASASELLINNLKPHLDVKLIGRTTYGKPVGFFDIKINKYELYVTEFETKNSANQGGYYSGMAPGSAEYQGVSDADDVTKDFGDPNEKLLAHALNYVRTGIYGQNLQVQSTDGRPANPMPLGKEGFSGMVFDKPFKLKSN